MRCRRLPVCESVGRSCCRAGRRARPRSRGTPRRHRRSAPRVRAGSRRRRSRWCCSRSAPCACWSPRSSSSRSPGACWACTGRTVVLLGVTVLLDGGRGPAHPPGPARGDRDLLAGRRRHAHGRPPGRPVSRTGRAGRARLARDQRARRRRAARARRRRRAPGPAASRSGGVYGAEVAPRSACSSSAWARPGWPRTRRSARRSRSPLPGGPSLALRSSGSLTASPRVGWPWSPGSTCSCARLGTSARAEHTGGVVGRRPRDGRWWPPRGLAAVAVHVPARQRCYARSRPGLALLPVVVLANAPARLGSPTDRPVALACHPAGRSA